ncbi:phosphoenolpyruvate--protein phosphotransferase [Chitinivibrio alkaliphilus]|uniref:Phosphoenolpyruvate-protein phosphotransferase n=1 Tax=Chitinivibrio alkaliphilus ACht1 TaxID=1313304 RepID=U7D6Y1_9BACT|nr:phosphoenolpyruvate--protein phosphotransferase [Chitinivibrio alkaliphilus]ERP31703.1 phosphoenolpyruvate-protein phosphotransferase [Chitinivibrio alkaliphilus ACht1]
MATRKVIQGTAIVRGKGLGKAYFIGRAVQDFTVETIPHHKVVEELDTFEEVRTKVKQYYRNYNMDTSEGHDESGEGTIMKIYEHIMDDPAFKGQVTEYISRKNYTVESAVRSVSKEFIDKFNSAGTSYFRDRSSDMVEICETLINFLNNGGNEKYTFSEDVVLVIDRSFTPSDIVNYNVNKIKGVVSKSAGRTSHAAILARSYSIPVITGVEDIKSRINPHEPVLINAYEDQIIIHPSSDECAEYTAYRERYLQAREVGAKRWHAPAYTPDGVHISVLANISFKDDVHMAQDNGADGIGLVRTEYLLSERETFPDEEEQFAYYSHIISEQNSREIVIRVMDIGGDKAAKFLKMPKEGNPFMGWRAVRILLERKELFRTQLRAIIRAGQGSNYKIMYPMVTSLSEWREIKQFTHVVADELGLPCPPLGILFEVPLAILEIDSFLEDIDFASIGTNDLIQYLSAADRNNSKVNYLYNPAEPAFLRIVDKAIDACTDKGIPISICGEMAGDPMYTIILLGLGLTRFSVIPAMVPIVKEIVSKINFLEIQEELSHLLSVTEIDNIADWIEKKNEELLSDIFERYQIDTVSHD